MAPAQRISQLCRLCRVGAIRAHLEIHYNTTSRLHIGRRSDTRLARREKSSVAAGRATWPCGSSKAALLWAKHKALTLEMHAPGHVSLRHIAGILVKY